MGHFRNVVTGVVVSVDDSKDARYRSGLWESADKPAAEKAEPAVPVTSDTAPKKRSVKK